MKKRTQLFLVLSVAIALIDLGFVVTNNRASEKAFQASLEQEGERLRAGFNLLLDRTLTNMMAIATFIASDAEVQDLFLEGRQAVESEGGGAGGAAAAAARQRLFDQVGPSWEQVQEEFSARQLHFHLGPGDTSFLRVHRPDRFGDDLTSVRFTIVDTNAEGTTRSGFETGRVYSGLRGVVPVIANDPETGQTVQVGALEVGNSFDSIMEILDRRFQQGAGVLLTMDHINATMWPDFIESHFAEPFAVCDCVIEAASRDGLGAILGTAIGSDSLFSEQRSQIVTIGDLPLAVTSFPIRDYLGQRDPDRANVGAMVFWRDATAAVAAHNRSQWFNVFYGIGGFVLIEALLFVAFRFAMSRLEQEVTTKTSELATKNLQLERLSATDQLTGLFNRMKLDDTFAQEIGRADRYDHPLSVILVDIDHFKSVNDTHGHQVGDQVLIDFGDLLRHHVREVDIPGRWGGEEFMVICPETDQDGAQALAENLRAAVAGHAFPVVGGKTGSFGVATRQGDEGEDDMVARADAALYRAKEQGRNRVEVALPA